MGRGSVYRRGHPGGMHPWGVCIGQTPPPDTAGYGQRAVGTHPTGIHSCFGIFSKMFDMSRYLTLDRVSKK